MRHIKLSDYSYPTVITSACVLLEYWISDWRIQETIGLLDIRPSLNLSDHRKSDSTKILFAQLWCFFSTCSVCHPSKCTVLEVWTVLRNLTKLAWQLGLPSTDNIYQTDLSLWLLEMEGVHGDSKIKGTWQWGGFLGFCINWFLIDPLHYLSRRFDFGFEFAEIFVIEKWLPASASRGVGDSPTCRVGESLTLRFGESESRLLNV